MLRIRTFYRSTNTTLLLVAFIGIQTLASTGQPSPKPMSKEAITKFLKGDVPPTRAKTLVRERGIEFQATAESGNNLRTAGATNSLLSALRGVAPKLSERGGGTAVPQTGNNALKAWLDVTPSEVTYERVGRSVRALGTATVSWSVTGAGPGLVVTLDPLGKVGASGSVQVQPVPQQNSNGPVDETITYTLHATNSAGGDVTRTATLHVTGAIKPGGGAEVSEVESSDLSLALVSLYFPTDLPTIDNPEGGLLKSQQDQLKSLARGFKAYQEHDPNARLSLEAHADVHESMGHSMELTERRAARAKQFLVAQGIAASAIDTKAMGKESQLGKDKVQQLEAQNPHTPPAARLKAADADWMAYNRRVDVVLQPLGLHSSKFYPHQAADSSALWQQPKPISKEAIIKLLKGDAPPNWVETQARQRGIDFQITSEAASELRRAGANPALLKALRELAPNPAPPEP